MQSKIGEMHRYKSITEKEALIAFTGRTLDPSIPAFEVQRDIIGHWSVIDKDGKKIGYLIDAGCDHEGRDLFNLIYFRSGVPVLLACVEIQPNLFAIHLRAEDQACVAGVIADGGPL